MLKRIWETPSCRLISVIVLSLTGPACEAQRAHSPPPPPRHTVGATTPQGSSAPSAIDQERLLDRFVATAASEKLGRVESREAASETGMPSVVVIPDAHLNEGTEKLGFTSEKYTDSGRTQIAGIMTKAFRLTELLIDLGVRKVVGELLPPDFTRHDLDDMRPAIDDLDALMRHPPEKRRAEALRMLRLGTNIPTGLVVFAVYERVDPIGAASRDLIRTTLELSEQIRLLEHAGPQTPSGQLRQRALSGEATEDDLRTWAQFRRGVRRLLEQFDQVVITQRDRALARRAVEVGRDAEVPVVVVIAGGYHARGIVRELERVGAGHLLVALEGYPDAFLDHRSWLEGLRKKWDVPGR